MDTVIRQPTRRSRIASFGIAITALALAFVFGFTIGAWILLPGNSTSSTHPIGGRCPIKVEHIGITDEPQPSWASPPPPGTITPTGPV